MIRLFCNFRIVTFLFCEGRHGVMVMAIGVSTPHRVKVLTSNNNGLLVLSKKAHSYPEKGAKWGNGGLTISTTKQCLVSIACKEMPIKDNMNLKHDEKTKKYADGVGY